MIKRIKKFFKTLELSLLMLFMISILIIAYREQILIFLIDTLNFAIDIAKAFYIGIGIGIYLIPVIIIIQGHFDKHKK